MGHLHVVAALYASDQSPGFAINGIYYLGKAAKLNNAYLSCYTSCHAELGDNRECLLASERILSENIFSGLAAEEENIVRAEINFYMAIAHLNLSEFANARKRFGEFRNKMKNTSFDAIRHAELFETKTKLKSNPLADLSSSVLQRLARDINILDFTSQASTSIQDEKISTENALMFLSVLLSDVRGSVKKPDVELMGDMQKFMRSLVLTDHDLINKVCITIFWANSGKRKSLIKKLEDRFESLFMSVGLSYEVCPIRIDPFTGGRTENSVECSFMVNFGDTWNGDDEISLCDFLDTQGKKKFDYDNAVSWIVVVTAFYLLVRFIYRDRYVFALAPCENSPALTYQQPSYYLKDLVDVLQ